MSIQVENFAAPPTASQSRSIPTGWGYAEIGASVLRHCDPRLIATRPLRVLEAGGGSDSWLPLPPDTEITTIDISAEQLAMNTYAHEKLLGDLQTFDYGTRRFDLVIVWDVLEHLERPYAAVNRLARTLAPGGRLIIKGPMTRTLKGLVTRFTPHALHVAFYRRVLGSVHAGEPGHPPFKTHLAFGSDPRELIELLASQGLEVDALEDFESAQVTAIAKKGRVLLWAYRAGEALVALLSGGRYQSGVTDFYLIVRRPA